MTRRNRGIAVYSEIFGLPEAEVVRAMDERVGSEFADEVFEAAGGRGWSHPALAPRERDIVVITALVAQGVMGGDRLGSHVRLGMSHGLDQEAFTALGSLLAAYVGYPYASLAMETVRAEVAAFCADDRPR